MPFVAAFLLMFAFLTFPHAPPTDQGGYEADAALSTILNYAHEQHLQFGTDLAYTYGPLGYLIFFYFYPGSAECHMITDLVICFTVALGLCLVGWRLKRLWRGLLLAGFAWGAANVYPRTDAILNVGLLCWGLLCFVETGPRLTWAVGVLGLLAAFCALAKVSYLFVGAACVLAVSAGLLVRGKPQLASALTAGSAAAFLAGWVLAGQAPNHIGAYVTNSVAMARGYNAALGWEELPLARNWGGCLAALLLVLAALRLRQAFADTEPRPILLRLIFAAWLTGLCFTVYKHAFVRGLIEDLNMGFLFATVLAPVLTGFGMQPQREAADHNDRAASRVAAGAKSNSVMQLVRSLALSWGRISKPCEGSLLNPSLTLLSLGCWLVPLITLQALSFPGPGQSAAQPFLSFVQNLHWALQPQHYLRACAAAFETNRDGAALPRLRQIIGNHSVDVFGRRQFFAVLNELNYRPRPVPQSYAACNAELMRLNEAFYLSDAAPEFILLQLDTFDRKFPPLEDARVLRYLLVNYELVAAENQCLLLKKSGRESPQKILLRAGTVQPGQKIMLSEDPQTNLWLEVSLAPSWRGALRQMLYRPPVVRLCAWSANGSLARRRAPASMLQAGFLASPLLLNNENVEALYGTNPPARPQAYTIELAAGQEQLWQPTISYRLYKLENQLGRRPEPDSAPRPTAMPQSAKDKRWSSGPFSLFHTRAWRSGATPGGPQELASYIIFALVPCVSGGLLVLLFRHRLRRNGALRDHPSSVASKMGASKVGGAKPAAHHVLSLLAGNALIFVFLASLAFLAAETYFRFVYDTTDSLGFTRVSERWVQRHWQVNRAGCRDNIEYSPALQPGHRRITFVGDSFTAGHGIKNVEERFANLLRQTHPDWDIQVLANVGLDTGGEQQLLNRALRQGYQLNDVVLVYCLNDVADLMPEQGQIYEQLLANQGGWLCQNSYVLNLLYNHYRAAHIPLLRNYFPFVRAAYQGPLWENQKQRLKHFRDTVQAHGGRLSVMTFPFFDVLGTDYPFNAIHAVLDENWRRLNVPHLDLLPIYNGLTPAQLMVNRYDAHPNELANKLAAQALEKFLTNEVH